MGLIGTGNIGQSHLLGIEALREAGLVDVEITALCDIDKESLQRTADFYGVTQTYEDYVDLINDENVDLVYVCTPTNKHIDMVKAAAEANKDVLCEKPLAHSCPQARDLFAVAKSKDIKTGVGLVLRFDPILLYAKKLIETKDFGQPMHAHIRDDQHFPVDYILFV